MLNVIFDMDGVIFDSEHVCERCWRDYDKAYALRDVGSMFHDCIGTTVAKTKEIVLGYQGEDFPYEQFIKDASNRFHEIEAAEGLPVKKGARELLSWLRKSGARIGLASSTKYNTVLRQLTHADLAKYFDIIIGGEMAAKSKPEPDIYLEACKRLGVRPKESFGIEDSYNGVRSLAAAKLMPVMVPDLLPANEEMRGLCVEIFNDLCEVQEYFARL